MSIQPADLSTRRARYLGLGVTLLTIVLIEVFYRLMTPHWLLVNVVLIPVTYTAFVGGIRFGLVAALMAVLYTTWHQRGTGSILSLAPDPALCALVMSLVTISIVLMVGWLRQRAEIAHAALRAQLIQQVQTEERTRSEWTLHDTRERYRALSEAAHDMIFVINRDDRIDFVNAFAAAQFGVHPSALVGKKRSELFPPDADDRLAQNLTRVFETGETVDAEGLSVLPGGQRWLHTRLVPLRNTAGRISAVLGISRDITERKIGEDLLRDARDQLEQRVQSRTSELQAANENLQREIAERQRAEQHHRASEERLQAILDNAPAVVYLKDEQGKYILVNRRFEELFHITRDQVVGRTDYDIFPKENADLFRANDRKVLLENQPLELEEIAPHDDGPHTYISLKFPLQDTYTGAKALCGISTDITDRKKFEEALQQAKTAAEEASRAKSRFLANISHEIRTPINAMLGAAEMLRQEAHDPARLKSHSEMILRNGRHLIALIDDLLNLSRIEAGTLAVHPAPVSLLEVLADVTALTTLHRTEKPQIAFSVHFDSALPAEIITDRTRLTQAIGNLIGNAFKFTNHGRVELHIRATTDSPEPMVEFDVVDTGRGISQRDTERIFEAFVQIPPQLPGAMSGVGLGLALTRWIAQSLGGSLTVQSKPGEGSTFTLRIATGSLANAQWLSPETCQMRLQKPEQAAAAEFPVQLSGNVLVADDAEDALSLVYQALTRAGARVTCARNGQEVLSLPNPEQFDLILMDVRMPVIDGLTTAKELRRRGYRGPIIAITASASVNMSDNNSAGIFDDVWCKPLSLAALVEKSAAYLPAPGHETSQPPSSSNDRIVSLLREAAETFRGSLPARLEELESAVRRKDHQAARDILHNLVGTAGIHGFADISQEAAALMQKQGKNGNSLEESDLQRLRRHFQQAVSGEAPAISS